MKTALFEALIAGCLGVLAALLFWGAVIAGGIWLVVLILRALKVIH